MITLIQYPISKTSKVLNNSPFCAKLEFFLIVNKLDYKIRSFTGNPKSTPTGKLPYIEYKDKKIPDSTEIIKLLSEELKIDMESTLSLEQKSQSFAIRKMLEEYLYWILIYSRWIDEDNWPQTKKVYFGHLPPLINSIIPAMVRKDVKKASFYHGMGRHPKAKIYDMGKECFTQLSNQLGDKKFFFGDTISLLDITVFGFLSNIVFDFNTKGTLVNLIQNDPNLIAYIIRLDKDIVKSSKVLK